MPDPKLFDHQRRVIEAMEAAANTMILADIENNGADLTFLAEDSQHEARRNRGRKPKEDET